MSGPRPDRAARPRGAAPAWRRRGPADAGRMQALRAAASTPGLVLGLALALVAAVALAPAGCHGPADGPADGPAIEPRGTTPEEVASILAAHAERTARLDRIHVVGTVGIEWPDVEGEWQEEQVSVRVWVDGPWRTAARFLIGFPETDLFWFGSDERRTWLFDLAADETFLCTWAHASRERPRCADAVLPAIGRPLSAADLLFAAVPLPPDAADRAQVSDDGRTVSLVTMGRQEPIRLTWDAESGRLRRVAVLDALGEPWATAEHSAPEPLAVEGLARPLQPRLASRVVVRDRDERFTARFDFDLENSPSLASQRWGTLFDLPTLRRILDPDVVEGETDAG